MKTLIFLLICIALSASSLSAQTKRRPQPKPKVDLAKKIADATPEALPLGPRSGKPITDARDMNLKGKVKSVVEFTIRPGGVREVDNEKYFDEDGFVTKEIEYMDGYPDSVTVWGWIDGARVSRTNDIEYVDGEKPPPRYQTLKETYVPSANYAKAPADDRYTTKHLYKYDDLGRLIEDHSISNYGEPLGKMFYTYTADRRDERYFGSDGNEWSHAAYVVDKNGDHSEQLMFGVKDRLENDYIYQHTLDSQGNWIVEKTFEKKMVRRKLIQKQFETTYRTITYYQ